MTAEYRNFAEALDAVVSERGAPVTWEGGLDLVLEASRRIMTQRHEKYGPGNINRHGLTGVAVRLGDKLERFDRWIDNGKQYADETSEDTLGDLADYGIIGIMFGRDWWNLPADCLDEVQAQYCEAGAHAATVLERCGVCSGDFCPRHSGPNSHACAVDGWDE